MFVGKTLDMVAETYYGVERKINESDNELRERVREYMLRGMRQQFNSIFELKNKTIYICG